MKKTTLLKSMLLLCALIVGSSYGWAGVSSTAATSVSDGDIVAWGTSSTNLASSVGSNWIYLSETSSDWIYFRVHEVSGGFQLEETSSGNYIYSSAAKKVELSSENKTTLTINGTNYYVNGGESIGNYTFNSSGIRPYSGTNYTAAYLYKVSFESHTASFSINGVIDDNDNDTVEEGSDITFPSVPATLGGKKFMGWTTSAIVGTQNDAPATLVSSATMSTSDITYYAVFATASGSGTETYEKLANQSFDTKETYVIGAEQSGSNSTMWYFYSYSSTDTNISWGVMTSSPSTNTPVYFTLSGTASALVAKDDSNNYIAGLTTGKFKMSSTSTSIALDTDGTIKNSSSGSYKLRHNYNGGSGGLRWYDGTTGTPAYFYKVIPGYTYSAYCTTVTVSGTISDSGYNTFSSSYALDLRTLSNANGAYVASGVSNGKVVLSQTTSIMAASTDDSATGLFIAGTAGQVFTIKVTSEGATFSGTNMLLAAPNGTTVTDAESGYYNYVFGWSDAANPGFYLISGTDAKLDAGKAYLHTSAALNAPEGRGGFIFEDENTTGIAEVSTKKAFNGDFYNLAGQKVAQPTKGLYIVNGKKVIIK